MIKYSSIATLLYCLLAYVSTGQIQSEYSAVEFVDEFLANNGNGTEAAASAFVDTSDRIWVSSANESTPVRNLSVSEYLEEITTIQNSFSTQFNTVVSIHRQAGPLATVFCSVYGKLIDTESDALVFTRAIHSYKLIKHDDGWKILQLNIQNENEPFESDLWPDVLTNQYPLESKSNEKIYEKDRPYNIDEVDLPPLYPFETELEELMNEFDVHKGQMTNESPFTIYINEDGEAVLGYVGDLSGEQIEAAKTFVSKMSPWYPAEVDKSSVKCKLIFSIK